ncbi:MAG: hypothetical protein ABSB35_20475 [Bryobacteraceae bacterium]|jgi:hypothetical protein
MKFFIVVVMGVCAWAQAELERPQLGTMLDSNGAVRPVFGLPGSITVGEATLTGVLSTTCSAKLCLAKTESGIWSASGMTSAPNGPAIFALDGTAAFVYFPETRQFARWYEGQLDFLDLDIDGKVLAFRAGKGNSIEIAVRQRNQVQVVDAGLEVIASLPADTRVVMLIKDGVLYAVGNTVILQRPDGTETRFQAPNVEAAFALGDGYIELRAGASTYAVRVDRGREQIFLLPEVGQ